MTFIQSLKSVGRDGIILLTVFILFIGAVLGTVLFIGQLGG